MNLNDPLFEEQDPLSLGFLSKQWLKSMKLAGFKPQTLATHFKWIRLFLRWCEIRGLKQVPEVTRSQVEAYQASLVRVPAGSTQPALKPITRSNRLSTVRLFFKWCAKKRILVYNPAADLEMPRVPKILPRDVLTVAEVEQILAACDLKFTMGIRNRAMIETFYSTGIRRNELRYLKPKDIDFKEGTLMVRDGKGGKDRMVPIGKRALAWISKYLDEVRSQAPLGHEPWLFLTRTGKSVSNLTPIVWETMKKAGVNKEGSCHLFRHTMATLMLKNGADVRVVQEILGHAKIQTTQRYTHLCIDHLKLVHEKTHPARYPKEREQETDTEETGAELKEEEKTP